MVAVVAVADREEQEEPVEEGVEAPLQFISLTMGQMPYSMIAL